MISILKKDVLSMSIFKQIQLLAEKIYDTRLVPLSEETIKDENFVSFDKKEIFE